MNWEPWKKYLVIGSLYILLTLLVVAYRYFRSDQFNLTLLYHSVGLVGVLMVGFFLLSKSFRSTFPQLNAWQEIIELLGTVGIATSLFTISSPQLTIIVALHLIFLALYSKHLLKTGPQGLAQNLKNLLGVFTLMVLLFINIIERFTSLNDWFAFVLNLGNPQKNSLLPPTTILLALYIIFVISVYLWVFFTEPSEIESTKTPPPQPTPPTPPIQQPPS